jgi:hypothetical protein
MIDSSDFSSTTTVVLVITTASRHGRRGGSAVSRPDSTPTNNAGRWSIWRWPPQRDDVTALVGGYRAAVT